MKGKTQYSITKPKPKANPETNSEGNLRDVLHPEGVSSSFKKAPERRKDTLPTLQSTVSDVWDAATEGSDVLSFADRRYPILTIGIIILFLLTGGGGTFLISREAKFRTLQENVRALEIKVDNLEETVRKLETEDAWIKTRLDNLED